MHGCALSVCARSRRDGHADCSVSTVYMGMVLQNFMCGMLIEFMIDMGMVQSSFKFKPPKILAQFSLNLVLVSCRCFIYYGIWKDGTEWWHLLYKCLGPKLGKASLVMKTKISKLTSDNLVLWMNGEELLFCRCLFEKSKILQVGFIILIFPVCITSCDTFHGKKQFQNTNVYCYI